MKDPVLVILAAGMGSRYGGLKQIEPVGNNGESIIDFTIYDAIEAGFKKVILIIRKEHQSAFEDCLTNKIKHKIEVEFAFQSLDDLPEGVQVPTGREKPWGTTHALLACRTLDAPFMICNADDYYGKDAFKTMYHFLKNEVKDSCYGMVGYELVNTLTEHGTVTRALCESSNQYLNKIEEIQNIRKNGAIAEYEVQGEWKKAALDALASMNYWGFTPKIFTECESLFAEFLKQALIDNPMKGEHVIPTAVGELLKQDEISIKVMSSKDKWFGVTYKEDKPNVVAMLENYKAQGLYPFNLWEK